MAGEAVTKFCFPQDGEFYRTSFSGIHVIECDCGASGQGVKRKEAPKLGSVSLFTSHG
jgi:hypothetical protein